MPNHVYSNVQLKGSEEAIGKFVLEAKLEGVWNFNRLYPNPLTGYASPIRVVSEEEYAKAINKNENDLPFDVGLPMTAAMRTLFEEQHGTANWYDWANTHWGTKWGIYEIEEISISESELEFSYYTAWGPANGLWMKISELYPDILIETEFADEGGNFAGIAIFCSGQLLSVDTTDVDSEVGKEICDRLGLTFLNEEEETSSEQDVAEQI
jgi:hypothetical protein